MILKQFNLHFIYYYYRSLSITRYSSLYHTLLQAVRSGVIICGMFFAVSSIINLLYFYFFIRFFRHPSCPIIKIG